MTITTNELRELLGKVTPGEWRAEEDDCGMWIVQSDRDEWVVKELSWSNNEESDARLIALAPDLARRVIAAENLVAASRPILQMDFFVDSADDGDPVILTKKTVGGIRSALREYVGTK